MRDVPYPLEIPSITGINAGTTKSWVMFCGVALNGILNVLSAAGLNIITKWAKITKKPIILPHTKSEVIRPR